MMYTAQHIRFGTYCTVLSCLTFTTQGNKYLQVLVDQQLCYCETLKFFWRNFWKSGDCKRLKRCNHRQDHRN